MNPMETNASKQDTKYAKAKNIPLLNSFLSLDAHSQLGCKLKNRCPAPGTQKDIMSVISFFKPFPPNNTNNTSNNIKLIHLIGQ